jgi:hypothetical protein
MPVIITACVSKKVGQANYGSAGYSLTVQCEVSNLDQVKEESHRLYNLLNESINSELSGENQEEKRAEWPTIVRNNAPQEQEWRCSPAQKLLIEKIANENDVMGEVESLADEMFSSPLSQLNKMQASSLLQEVIARWGKKPSRGTAPTGRFNGRPSR